MVCADCQYWRRQLPWYKGREHALFAYQSEIKTYFERFKRQGDYQLKDLFGSDLGRWWAKNSQRYDAVVPVPGDEYRSQQRGFEPVAALFETVFPLTPVLVKQGTTAEQAQQDRRTRLMTRQPFIFQPSRGLGCRHWRRVLLVDDIYTTGSTLHQAAAVLHGVGITAQMDTFTLAC